MTSPAPAPDAPPHVNVLFRALVPATGLFVVTLFAWIALLFSDPDAPRSPVAEFLDAHVVTLLAAEIVGVVALALGAMALDRRQTLRHLDANRRSRDGAVEGDGASAAEASNASGCETVS